MNITILGGGSWGTALGIHLAKNKNSIKIWEFFEEQARKMQEKRTCPLLPTVKIPPTVFVTSNLREALTTSELVLLVVPSDKVEGTIEKAKPFLGKQPVIICSKGLGKSAKLLSDIVKEKVSNKVYCLYGPTHAEEVCHGLYSGIVLAGGPGKEALKKVIESPNLKVDLSDDLMGVQIAAALKNIIAVFVGILEGMKLGDNAKAYVMTRGLDEIIRIGVAYGAKKETFLGLAGVGDLIVTCTSEHSRNRSVGEQLGKGRKLPDILSEMKMAVEGVTTVKQAYELQKKLKLKLPLIMGLYQILFEDVDPKEILKRI